MGRVVVCTLLRCQMYDNLLYSIGLVESDTWEGVRWRENPMNLCGCQRKYQGDWEVCYRGWNSVQFKKENVDFVVTE